MVGENPGFTAFRIGELPFKIVEPCHNDFTASGDFHIRGQEQLHSLGNSGHGITGLEVKVSKDNLQG